MPACVVICQRYYVIRLALFLFVVGKAPKSTLRSYFNAFDFSMRSVKYFNNLASLALARVLKQTRRRRKRENVTSRFCNHLSIIQSHYT